MTESNSTNQPPNWWRFGCMVEGGLFGVALLLALIFDSSLIDQYQWGWREALIGLVAVVPMLGMFYECLRSQIASMKEIRSYLELHMRPMFERLSVLQLAALSILAGLGEEALFRGVIQHNLEGPIGLFGAMLISNVLFGFAHFMTKAYFLLALMIGFFLSGIYSYTEGLLAPTITHALYDFIALIWFLRTKPVLSEDESEGLLE